MTVNEALELMTAKADERLAELEKTGVTVRKTVEYLNSFFGEAKNPAKAKFVNVTLTLSTEGLDEELEYCISLSAHIKRGKVNEEELSKTVVEFDKCISDTVNKLEYGDSLLGTLKELAEESEKEYEKLLSELEDMTKKQRRNSVIGTFIVIGGILLLVLVATLI